MEALITDPLVIVSDIHLLDELDERGQKLLALIVRLDVSAVRHFVLLGDIFDFCFGSSRYFHRKYARVGAALGNLAAQGVEVTFIEGNHEFALADLPWPGVRLIHGLGRTIKLGEISIALTHGDQLEAPWHYRWYRWLTRTRLFKVGGLAMPAGWLDRLALNISQHSRQRGRLRQIDHERIIGRLKRWYQFQNCHHGIVGHYHIPYHLPESRGEIVCLESWDRPNYLAFRQGNFVRVYL